MRTNSTLLGVVCVAVAEKRKWDSSGNELARLVVGLGCTTEEDQ